MNVKSQATIYYSYDLEGTSFKSVSTSNTLSTPLKVASFFAKKIANTNYFKPGDIITYTIVINNASNFKVTNISNNFNVVIGSNDIISSVNSENMMDTELNIQPGICEQYADIQIYDRTGIFHELALRELLSQDERISIYTDNDILIGVYYVKEWSIENDNDIINITCRDNSYLFQKIDIKRSLIATRTLHDLLNILFSQATEVSWEYMDIET